MLDARSAIGTHDLLWVTLDTLRYDVAERALDAGMTPQLAKLLLGVCLLQKAAATATAAPDAAKMRAEALTTFKQIVVDCDAAEKRNGKLTDREGWLRLQSALRVLQTHQQMKKPQELLYDAAPLLDRHKGTVEELIVLSLVYHAFKQLGATRLLATKLDMSRRLGGILAAASGARPWSAAPWRPAA